MTLSGKDGKIFLPNGKEIATKTDWVLNRGDRPVDATVFGESKVYEVPLTEEQEAQALRYMMGLKDVSGSFTGLFDMSGDILLNAAGDQVPDCYLYSEAPLPWYQSWFYRLFARWVDWPTIVVAYGKVSIEAETEELDDETLISGSFTSAGTWTVVDYLTPVQRAKRVIKEGIQQVLEEDRGSKS